MKRSPISHEEMYRSPNNKPSANFVDLLKPINSNENHTKKLNQNRTSSPEIKQILIKAINEQTNIILNWATNVLAIALPNTTFPKLSHVVKAVSEELLECRAVPTKYLQIY